MKTILPILFTVVVGILNAFHSGTNAKLEETLGRPWWITVFVAGISCAAALVLVGVMREPFPAWEGFGRTPWWAWVGTVIAVVPIVATILFAGQLGAATYNGLVVTATLVTAVVLDHFGIVGFRQHPAGLWRIVGSAMMIGGIALVSVF
ncbi:MAG: DMT family transporter [Gluconacetobacter diazotrophicus]|nr:DMT family transporter [Gluconacetobacter diazotrophicus]